MLLVESRLEFTKRLHGVGRRRQTLDNSARTKRPDCCGFFISPSGSHLGHRVCLAGWRATPAADVSEFVKKSPEGRRLHSDTPQAST